MTTEIQVKERPILFSGPMVRALKAGTKTQTRRAIKFAKSAAGLDLNFIERNWVGFKFSNAEKTYSDSIPCPYGKVGDRLWVRETFGFNHAAADVSDVLVYRADYDSDKVVTSPRDRKRSYQVAGEKMEYTEDANHWHPSIFMKREASRLLLEITAVRCERLQSISEADAVTEGIERRQPYQAGPPCFLRYHEYKDYCDYTGGQGYESPTKSYRSLWNSINGPDSWAANPWVWVVEFKVLTVNA